MSDETENGNIARDSRWFRTAAYVIMAVAGAFGLWKVTDFTRDVANESEERVAAISAESEQRSKEICRATNQTNAVLLELIRGDGQPDSGDLNVDPEIFTMQTPEVQALLREIGENSAESNDEFLKRASALLVQRDCESIHTGG